MHPTIDETDILILHELQDDGHLTIKELSLKVHLSVSPVYERVRRLEREGFIKRYVAVLDPEKLDCGFMAFCYLKMKQHSHENAVQIMQRVQDIPEIAECYNISGDFDFLLKIYVRNMRQYQEFVMRILGDIPAIGSLNSSFVLGEVKNSHRLPFGNER
ncbi:MAG: Lrp/AsnC family transcriptional regulator [Prevotella sp.]